MVLTGFDDRRNAQLARVFIEACTRRSEHSEDILPQEAGPDGDCSPFHVFSLVFPEIVGKHGSGRRNKRMRKRQCFSSTIVFSMRILYNR